jgi:DNA-binding MarR family transcriptional regulator
MGPAAGETGDRRAGWAAGEDNGLRRAFRRAKSRPAGAGASSGEQKVSLDLVPSTADRKAPGAAARGPDAHPAADAAASLQELRLRAWVGLLRLTRTVSGDLRDRLRAEIGFTLPQFDALATLAQAEKGLAMSAIAEAMQVSPGNVTGLIDRLVERGFVVRAVSGQDRRKCVVRITEAGRAAFRAAAERHEIWVARALQGLDAEQCRALLEITGAACRDGTARRR